MFYFKKVLPLFFLCSCVTAYSAKQHVIQFDIADDKLQYNTVIAFIYDTTSEKGPGAIVYNRTDNRSSTILFGRNVFGPSVSVTQASVQSSVLPYQDYAVNATCKNLDLQSLDSRGLFISMHVNVMSMSIDCTTVKTK